MSTLHDLVGITYPYPDKKLTCETCKETKTSKVFVAALREKGILLCRKCERREQKRVGPYQEINRHGSGAKTKNVIRKCLMCDRPFGSRDSYRVCDDCKKTDRWKHGSC